jgi:glycosyltransferase involved in cell wall biosynthesis
VSIPVIATLHTVPADPTTGQTEVLEELGSISRTLVVMSRVARNRLLDAFDIDPAKVVVIPHGTHGLGRAIPRHGQGRTIVTWGLIGPGKGIEWGIEAMAHLRHLSPPPRYLIFGQTHPMVKRRQGEAYRNSLHDRVRGLSLERIVEIRDCHLSIAELAAVLEDADVALLPYDSTDQVTSGVLSEAVAAGLPVVATEFPHAIELLSQGAGVTVPHRDPAAIATALTVYLTDPDKRRIAANLAIEASRDLLWDSVAHQHGRVAERAVLLRSAGHR